MVLKERKFVVLRISDVGITVMRLELGPGCAVCVYFPLFFAAMFWRTTSFCPRGSFAISSWSLYRLSLGSCDLSILEFEGDVTEALDNSENGNVLNRSLL